MRKINFRCTTTAVLFSGLLSATAAAQVLEEVVVTAQKRQQDSQDVGIAITAFTGDQLNALGVKQSFDAAMFTPGVHISGNLAGQNTQFSIRGVTQNDFNDVVEAPNAAYLDEGYIAIAQAQTFAVYDIERVEILKGPQGTLFGRNATGGLVHYISRKPSFEGLEGYADLTYGIYDSDADAQSLQFIGALGGPFSDKVAGRAAVLIQDNEGYLNNLYPLDAPSGLGSGPPGPGAGAQMGDRETVAVRGTLDFQLGSSNQGLLRFAVNYEESEVPTGPYQSKSTIAVVDEQGELINVIDTPPDETRLSIQGDGDAGGDAIDGDQFLPGAGIGIPERPLAGGDFFGYIDPDGAAWNTSGDFAFSGQGDTETSGVNVRLEWEFDNGIEFTSVSDWKSYDKLLFIDVDSAPVNQLANYAGVDATSFTQEFRLFGQSDKMRWVAGVYYLNIDTKSDNGLKAPENSIINGLGFPPIDIGVVADLKTDSYSVFGQLDYDFSERLTGTFGLRLIREEKDFSSGIGVFLSQDSFTVNQGDFLDNPFGAGSPFFDNLSSSDDLWAGKLQLDWRVSDDLLIYGGVNRGVKAGSFNAPLLGAYLGSGGTEGLPYKPEELLSVEGGFKWTSSSGRTRFNGTAFFYDYTDYQAFLFVGVGGVVINADAETFGAELELQSSPSDGWDLMLSIAAFDATVKDILLRNGSPLPPRDVDPNYAPEFQATGLARYEWEGLGGMMHVRGDVTYSDGFFYNLRNFDADQFDAYTMVNAGIGWTSQSGSWALNFDIRNLTDENAGVQGFDLATLCGCNEVAYQPPRWYGLNVRWSF